jgi:hypothetical protein
MDLKQYIPVGKDNALVTTVITMGGSALKGNAWLDAADSTTLSITVHEGPSVGSTWVVAIDHIVAMIPSTETPPEQRRK